MTRVLIVDDDRDGAALLKELLELEGCIAEAAYDGGSAMQFCGSHGWDVLLIDLHLPDMSGVELAQRVRASVAPVPRLLAVSGLSAPDAEAMGASQAFERFLTKPVDLEHLMALLRPAAS